MLAQVLSKMSLNSPLNQDTSALPGGNKLLNWESLGRRHWRQIVGLQLPDDATLGQFVDKFFVSVDWFMMVRALLSLTSIKNAHVCASCSRRPYFARDIHSFSSPVTSYTTRKISYGSPCS